MENIEFISAKDLPITEAEEVDVLCIESGELKRKAGANLGGGKVFVIDSTSDEYNTEDTAYGDTIKNALLQGNNVLYYDGTYYFAILGFYVDGTTVGSEFLQIYTGGVNTTGSFVANMTYSFACTV